MKFVFGREIAPETVGEGVSRKVLAHSPQIMVVEVRFRAGSVGAPHAHPHSQATYVVSGAFRFTNGGETRDVGPGDSLCFAPGVEHGTLCLQDGCLVDVFTPRREDFLA